MYQKSRVGSNAIVEEYSYDYGRCCIAVKSPYVEQYYDNDKTSALKQQEKDDIGLPPLPPGCHISRVEQEKDSTTRYFFTTKSGDIAIKKQSKSEQNGNKSSTALSDLYVEPCHSGQQR